MLLAGGRCCCAAQRLPAALSCQPAAQAAHIHQACFNTPPGVQIASDVVLQPLGRFAGAAGAAAYPATPAGRQVADELAMINLRAD